MAVDTGPTINVIDYNTLEKMKDVKLTRTNMKAFAYSKKSPVEFIGKFEALIETKKRIYSNNCSSRLITKVLITLSNVSVSYTETIFKDYDLN